MVITTISNLVSEYIDFFVEGKKVSIPYSMVKQANDSYDASQVTRTTRSLHYAGKGTPSEIKKTLLRAASQQQFDLQQESSERIHQFMLDNGIGVDCSGFVYNVVDKYLLETEKKRLGPHVSLFPGIKGKLEKMFFAYNRVRKCSAMTLTSELNTIEVSSVKEIRSGDLIRFTLPTWAGKHIGVIVEVTNRAIIYAHSGEKSKEKGPHLAMIKIRDPEKGLDAQEWLEKHEDGSSYKDHAFHPEKGDSVRRLKVLA